MPLSIDQRMECLRNAISCHTPGVDPVRITAAAIIFAAFVEGKAQTQLEAEVAEYNAPTPKAKKLTGALVGSEAKEIKLGGSQESRAAANPGASFDDVKMITLKLRDEVSKEAVRKVLDSYGAATIQDLTDIQWKQYVISCTAAIAKAPKPAPAAADDFGV